MEWENGLRGDLIQHGACSTLVKAWDSMGLVDHQNATPAEVSEYALW